jgi:hypothetical protein
MSDKCSEYILKHQYSILGIQWTDPYKPIINSFYKFKLISVYQNLGKSFVQLFRPTIVIPLCKIAKDLVVAFMSYVLIVVGAPWWHYYQIWKVTQI